MTQQIAKLFMNGRSQAVRLPAEFRFAGKEVFISKQGDKVILSPKKAGWDDFFTRKEAVPRDFMEGYVDLPPQERELL